MHKKNESFKALQWHPLKTSWLVIIWNLFQEIFEDLISLGILDKLKSRLSHYKIVKSCSKNIHQILSKNIEQILTKSLAKDFIFESKELCAHISINKKDLLEVMAAKDAPHLRVGLSLSRESAFVGLFSFYVIHFQRGHFELGDITKVECYTLFGGPTFTTAQKGHLYSSGKEALTQLIEELPKIQEASLIYSSKNIKSIQISEEAFLNSTLSESPLSLENRKDAEMR